MKSRGSSTLARQGWVPWLGLAVRLIAAGIWVFAGIAKIPGIQQFEVVVLKYGLLPNAVAAPVAYVLPFLELGIGIYFIAGLFVRGTALVGSLLFMVFLTAQAWAWLNGISLDCGCFGSVARSTVGPLTILRDFGLGIPTFLMLAFPARFVSLDHRIGGLHKQNT